MTAAGAAGFEYLLVCNAHLLQGPVPPIRTSSPVPRISRCCGRAVNPRVAVMEIFARVDMASAGFFLL